MSDSTNDKELRSVFERKFAEESVTPPPMAWSNIQAALPNTKTFFSFGTWSFVGGFILLTIIGISVYLNQNKPTKNQTQVTKKKVDVFQNEANAKNEDRGKENKKLKNEVVTSSQKLNEYSANVDETKTNVEIKNKKTIQNKSTLSNLTTDKGVSIKSKMSQNNLSKDAIVQANKLNKDKFASGAKSNGVKKGGLNSEQVRQIAETRKNESEIEFQSEARSDFKVIEKTLTQEKKNEASSGNITMIESVSVMLLKVKKAQPIDVQFNAVLAKYSIILPKPIIFNPLSIELFVASGRNFRTYNGMRDNNNINSSDIGEKTISMKNTAFGLNLGYRLNSKISFHTGFMMGRNVWKSDWFQKQLKNKTIKDQEGYDINSSDGQLRLASKETSTYFNSPNDSVLLRLRLVQRTRYISIPLLFRYTIPTKTLLQPFFSLGTTIDLKGRDRSRLWIDKDGEIRTLLLRRINSKSGGLKSGFQTSIGLSTAPDKRFGFFTELVYNQPFGSYYVQKDKFKVSSKQLQLRFGITLNF